MRIVFTSVGRRVELIQEFKRAARDLNTDLVIYGADITESAPAMFFCDKKVIVCRIDNNDYIPQLMSICKKERIDALIPTIDTDLLILSQNKELFDKIGTRVVLSNTDKIKICRDKRLTANFFLECGLKTPVPIDNFKSYKGTFPAFIKPLDGSSSINAYKVDNFSELETFASSIDGYIIQPYIEGIEYTVDVFCDFNAKPIYITPRIRLAVRSGEVLKTRIALDHDIIEESQKIIERFKPVGAITVQLIRQNNTGVNYYIEINPRYGGGAPLSIKSGADSPKALLKLLQGESLSYEYNAAEDNAIYSRFDQSIKVS